MTPAITMPFGDIPKIKELLKKHPKGLNITEISSALHLHRNTSAEYLDILKLKGDVDRKQIGTAKNYMLVQRMPVAALIRFSLHPAFILDARMEVVMVTGYGSVETADRLRKVTFYMGFCMDCHESREAPVDCAACHQ